MQAHALERRVGQMRLAGWLTLGLLTFLCGRASWPLAWPVAAFGALTTLLWPFVRYDGGQSGGDKETRRKGEEEREELTPNTEYRTPEFSPSGDPLCHSIEIGLDLIVVTALIGVTGGFGSPFAPLVFVVVLEAFVLLGRSAAIYAALAACLLNLAHFRAGVSLHSAILYGLAIGTLGVSALVVGMLQTREMLEGRLEGKRPGASLIRPPDMETLQAQLTTTLDSHEQTKAKFREVMSLHRDQAAQMARLRASEQLFEASIRAEGDDAGGEKAFTRSLRLVMEQMGAGGAVLWLRLPGSSALIVQAVAGRVADSLSKHKITPLDVLTFGDVRARCEEALLHSPVAARPFSRLDAPSALRFLPDEAEPANSLAAEAMTLLTLMADRPDESDSSPIVPVKQNAENGNFEGETAEAMLLALSLPEPMAVTAALTSAPAATKGLVGVTLLRTPPTPSEPNGSLIGAVGVCEPRGRAQFVKSELERLQSLSRALTFAIGSICERVESQRQMREITLLHDMKQLAASAADSEQVYEAIVEQTMQALPCENCTLFLLDAWQPHLEAKATRGRVVNLLDHMRFERGQGVSGWVAAYDKPLHIADLTQEPNLRNVEMIPPRVRSFIAMPLRAQGAIVGVLNVSHALPDMFTPDHLRFLASLAAQAAACLEQTTLLPNASYVPAEDAQEYVFRN